MEYIKEYNDLLIESSRPSKDFQSAMRKDAAIKRRLIHKAKTWMKQTGMDKAAAAKEFDLKLVDLTNEGVSAEYPYETWALDILARLVDSIDNIKDEDRRDEASNRLDVILNKFSMNQYNAYSKIKGAGQYTAKSIFDDLASFADELEGEGIFINFEEDPKTNLKESSVKDNFRTPFYSKGSNIGEDIGTDIERYALRKIGDDESDAFRDLVFQCEQDFLDGLSKMMINPISVHKID